MYRAVDSSWVGASRSDSSKRVFIYGSFPLMTRSWELCWSTLELIRKMIGGLRVGESSNRQLAICLRCLPTISRYRSLYSNSGKMWRIWMKEHAINVTMFYRVRPIVNPIFFYFVFVTFTNFYASWREFLNNFYWTLDEGWDEVLLSNAEPRSFFVNYNTF